MRRPSAQLICLVCLAWGTLLQGCSSTPPRAGMPVPVSSGLPLGHEIAMRAISLLGAPYRYGGRGPSAFDCSGLVMFVHDQLGISVPRTAAQQYSAARPVSLAGLEPGDLLFFRTQGSRVSHVAIYAGEGRFVHAPQTGRPVEFRALDDEYYRARFVGAGRLFE